MHVGVYGSGNLATVVSACLADFGVPVTCVDEGVIRITALAGGRVDYFEKNLQDVIKRNMRAGRLAFSSELVSLVRQRQIIYLAPDKHDYLEELALRISRLCPHKAVLVICTPVPV